MYVICVLVFLELTRVKTFKRSLRTSDWKRFETYASRVRQLEYFGFPELKPSVFDELYKTRRQLIIFPNLQVLEWSSPVNSYILFMHSGIEKFTLYMDHKFTLLGEEIVDRLPHLSHLRICSSYPMDTVEKELVDMLKQLSNLREVTLERFYSTERTIEALSHLKLLNAIEFEIDEHAEDRMDTDSLAPTIEKESFPALRELSVSANFDSGVASFWRSYFSLGGLTYFRVHSELIEKPDSVHKLACAVSKGFQGLKTLRLESLRNYNIDRDNSTEDFDDTDWNGNNIALELLKPLFKLSNLTSLEFYHQYPLLITQQEIEMIASSCPFIENLQLCNDPGFCMKSTLTLAALVPLAQHCIHLKSLGLFIDATKVPTMTPITQPFTSLSTLSVGLSIIKDEMPAVYLSQLICPECAIKCDFADWEDHEWDNALEEIVAERCRLWAVVQSIASKLSSVLAQERLRTYAAERELRDLKVRMKAQQEFLVAQGWLTES